MASITRLSDNTFNFIRWNKVTSGTASDLPVTDLDAISLSSPYELNNQYLRNQSTFYPCLLKNQAHLIHINLDSLISDADFANWRIDLYDNSGIEIDTALGTLNKCSIDGSDYRFYVSATIDSGVSNGIYQMVILNTVTGDLKYQSNCIRIISTAEISNYSYLEYRNSTDTFNYDYANVSGYNNLFLEMNVIDQQPESEKKSYRERSTGKLRNQKNQTSKVLTLETYFFDEDAHNMMLALVNHDNIKINGVEIEIDSDYQIDRNKMSKQNKGTVSIYDQRFSTINLNG